MNFLSGVLPSLFKSNIVPGFLNNVFGDVWGSVKKHGRQAIYDVIGAPGDEDNAPPPVLFKRPAPVPVMDMEQYAIDNGEDEGNWGDDEEETYRPRPRRAPRSVPRRKRRKRDRYD